MTALFELTRALTALYLEAPESVVKDVVAKVNAAIDEIRHDAERRAYERARRAVESVRDGPVVRGKRPGDAWMNACNDAIDAIRALTEHTDG